MRRLHGRKLALGPLGIFVAGNSLLTNTADNQAQFDRPSTSATTPTRFINFSVGVSIPTLLCDVQDDVLCALHYSSFRSEVVVLCFRSKSTSFPSVSLQSRHDCSPGCNRGSLRQVVAQGNWKVNGRQEADGPAEGSTVADAIYSRRPTCNYFLCGQTWPNSRSTIHRSKETS